MVKLFDVVTAEPRIVLFPSASVVVVATVGACVWFNDNDDDDVSFWWSCTSWERLLDRHGMDGFVVTRDNM